MSKTHWWMSAGLLVGIAVLPQWLAAQADPAKKAPVAEKLDRPAPLPTYFGMIAVDDAQRKKLYGIRDEYAGKLADLQKQIDKLEAERDARMEAELTPGQKLRLQELRKKAAEEKAAKKAEPNPATPAK